MFACSAERRCCNVLHCPPANIRKVRGRACPGWLWRRSLPGLASKSGKNSALLHRFRIFWLAAVRVLIPSFAWAMTGIIRWLQVCSLPGYPSGTAVLGFTGLEWQYGRYTLLSTGKSVVQFLLKNIKSGMHLTKPCVFAP